MEILNIKPLPHKEYHNCYEDQLTTVVEWWGFNHQWLYASSWDFSFEPSEDPNKKIGDMVGVNKKNIYTCMEEYCGIKSERYQNKSCLEFIEIIKKELSEGLPVILAIDPNINPKDISYGREDFAGLMEHDIIVTGLDEKKQVLYYTDSFYGLIKERLPFNINSTNNFMSCLTFRKTEPVKQMDWYSVIVKNIENLNEPTKYFSDSFQAIIEFGFKLRDSLDYKTEFINHNLEDFWINPLHYNINQLQHSHKQYAELLNMFYLQTGLDFFKKYISRFYSLASSWNVVLQLISKGSLVDDVTNIKQRMCNRLFSISEDEKQISMDLLESITINKVNNKISVQELPEKSDRRAGKRKTLQFLDLQDYTNNRGFESDKADITADFTGVGEYFIDDHQLWGNKLILKKTEFLLPDLSSIHYDNISCAEQIIKLTPDYYYQIMFLGCAEWGSFVDILQLNYQDKTIDYLDLSFSDWYAVDNAIANNFYKEEIAWTGLCFRNSDTEEKSPRRLYSISYNLNERKKLESIKLPDCSNLHIFAITMEK